MGAAVSCSRAEHAAIPRELCTLHGKFSKELVDEKKLRVLVRAKKLAPCYPQRSEYMVGELEECPICCTEFPALNHSSCCFAPICTECFVQVQTSSSPPGKAPCPYCKHATFMVQFYGPKSSETVARQKAEQQVTLEKRKRSQLAAHHQPSMSASSGGSSAADTSTTSDVGSLASSAFSTSSVNSGATGGSSSSGSSSSSSSSSSAGAPPRAAVANGPGGAWDDRRWREPAMAPPARHQQRHAQAPSRRSTGPLHMPRLPALDAAASLVPAALLEGCTTLEELDDLMLEHALLASQQHRPCQQQHQQQELQQAGVMALRHANRSSAGVGVSVADAAAHATRRGGAAGEQQHERGRAAWEEDSTKAGGAMRAPATVTEEGTPHPAALSRSSQDVSVGDADTVADVVAAAAAAVAGARSSADALAAWSGRAVVMMVTAPPAPDASAPAASGSGGGAASTPTPASGAFAAQQERSSAAGREGGVAADARPGAAADDACSGAAGSEAASAAARPGPLAAAHGLQVAGVGAAPERARLQQHQRQPGLHLAPVPGVIACWLPMGERSDVLQQQVLLALQQRVLLVEQPDGGVAVAVGGAEAGGDGAGGQEGVAVAVAAVAAALSLDYTDPRDLQLQRVLAGADAQLQQRLMGGGVTPGHHPHDAAAAQGAGGPQRVGGGVVAGGSMPAAGPASPTQPRQPQQAGPAAAGGAAAPSASQTGDGGFAAWLASQDADYKARLEADLAGRYARK